MYCFTYRPREPSQSYAHGDIEVKALFFKVKWTATKGAKKKEGEVAMEIVWIILILLSMVNCGNMHEVSVAGHLESRASLSASWSIQNLKFEITTFWGRVKFEQALALYSSFRVLVYQNERLMLRDGYIDFWSISFGCSTVETEDLHQAFLWWIIWGKTMCRCWVRSSWTPIRWRDWAAGALVHFE